MMVSRKSSHCLIGSERQWTINKSLQHPYKVAFLKSSFIYLVSQFAICLKLEGDTNFTYLRFLFFLIFKIFLILAILCNMVCLTPVYRWVNRHWQANNISFVKQQKELFNKSNQPSLLEAQSTFESKSSSSETLLLPRENCENAQTWACYNQNQTWAFWDLS